MYLKYDNGMDGFNSQLNLQKISKG